MICTKGLPTSVQLDSDSVAAGLRLLLVTHAAAEGCAQYTQPRSVMVMASAVACRKPRRAAEGVLAYRAAVLLPGVADLP